MRKLLRCKCGAVFVNDGVFLTCPACRHAYTEEQRAAQTGCRFWDGLAPDPRVHRALTPQEKRA